MTIRGMHTVHETWDLWNFYSFLKSKLDAAAARATDAWRAEDPASYVSFSVKQSLFAAKLAAFMPRLASTFQSADQQSFPDWDEVLARDGKTTPDGKWTGDVYVDLVALWKGDPLWNTRGAGGFRELDKAMRDGPADVAAQAPDYSAAPKPTAPDFDLDAYKVVDSVYRTVTGWISTGFDWALALGAIVVGGILLARRK
jgi:hypothetical protein